jgi:hypothetical protein
MGEIKMVAAAKADILRGSYEAPSGGIVLDFERLGWNFCSFGPTRTNQRKKRDTWVVRCRDGELKFISSWESETILLQEDCEATPVKKGAPCVTA